MSKKSLNSLQDLPQLDLSEVLATERDEGIPTNEQVDDGAVVLDLPSRTKKGKGAKKKKKKAKKEADTPQEPSSEKKEDTATWEDYDKTVVASMEADAAELQPTTDIKAPGTILKSSGSKRITKPRKQKDTLVPEGTFTGIMGEVIERKEEGGNIYRIATESPVTGKDVTVYAFQEWLPNTFEHRVGAVVTFEYKARPARLIKKSNRLMVWNISYSEGPESSLIAAAVQGMEHGEPLVTFSATQMAGIFLKIFKKDQELLEGAESAESLTYLYEVLSRDYELNYLGFTANRFGESFFRFSRLIQTAPAAKSTSDETAK